MAEMTLPTRGQLEKQSEDNNNFRRKRGNTRKRKELPNIYINVNLNKLCFLLVLFYTVYICPVQKINTFIEPV